MSVKKTMIRAVSALMAVVLSVSVLPIHAFAATKTMYRYRHYVTDASCYETSICGYYGSHKYGKPMHLEYLEVDQPLALAPGSDGHDYRHVYYWDKCPQYGCQETDTYYCGKYVDQNGVQWYKEEVIQVPVPDPVPPVMPEPDPVPPAMPEPAPAERVELQEVPYDSVWSEIDANFLDYVGNMLEDTLAVFSPKDEYELLKGFLSFRDCLDALLQMVIRGEVESETLYEAIGGVAGDLANLDDDTLEEVVPVIFSVLENEPETVSEIIHLLIRNCPKAVFSVTINAAIAAAPTAAVALSTAQIMQLQLVLICAKNTVLEYMKLYEALVDLYAVRSNHTDAICNAAENYAKSNLMSWENVATACSSDNADGREIVAEMEASQKEYRAYILGEIDKLQTFWFKVFHFKQNHRLEDVRERLLEMDVEYTAYYNHAKSVFGGGGGGGSR